MSSSIQNMSDELPAIRGAWQGGACPQCGDDMPANVVHCFTCRTMLNSELRDDTVEVPEFVPLPEIHHVKAAKARGHYAKCCGCDEELRINSKYIDATVQCRHCDHAFQYDAKVARVAMYANCPHCSEEIRASVKYVGQNVSCRFCEGALKLEG